MTNRANILVIDDDEVAGEVIAGVLRSAGFGTHVLASPIGATRTIREQQIHAVVCDLHMPAMRGDALARLFRQSKALHSLPLVLVSAANKDELRAILNEGIASAVVHKSDLEVQLISTLTSLLKVRR